MSTNHNRIKVADLETNTPDKILKTNLKGELEFSDASSLKTENYNALDYTIEGKALDARQGKVLKDMIVNNNINIASDPETQISTTVTEDNKVVSRSKLFNWWQWVKSQTQIISGAWNFTNKITLASGTKDTPSLIIPSGILTITPQNGAIERDNAGNLQHVSGSTRFKLLDSRDTNNFLSTTWRSTNISAAIIGSTNINKTSIYNRSINKGVLGTTDVGSYILKTFDRYLILNGMYEPNLIPPKSLIFELYLKGINCLFGGNQYVKLYSNVRKDTLTKFSIKNLEIPLSVSLTLSGTNSTSNLMYSEVVYDSTGNITFEIYHQHYLQSLSYSGSTGDMQFKDATIDLEFRVLVEYDDPTNQKLQNASSKSTYYNDSVILIKL